MDADHLLPWKRWRTNNWQAEGAVHAVLEMVNNPGADQTYRFIAFLSYRRGPIASPLARWLRLKLKNYKPPLELRNSLPIDVASTLFEHREVFLDTAFGNASDNFWTKNILLNLRASKFLIVISTPEAFDSRSDGSQNWVVREIDAFLESGRDSSRLKIVLAPGAPEEKFPGRLSEISTNWDWVDLRKFTMVHWWRQSAAEERDEAIAKLVAGLYNLPADSLPILRREERRRRGRIVRLAFAAGLLLLLVISGLGIAALWSAFEAEVLRREAVANETRMIASLSREELRQHRPANAVRLALTALGSQVEPSALTRFFAPWLPSSGTAEREAWAALSDSVWRSHERIAVTLLGWPIGPMVLDQSNVIYAASAEGGLQAWNPADPEKPTTLVGHVERMAWSPEGRRFATWSSVDGVVAVRGVDQSSPAIVLPGQAQAVWSMALSDGGHHVAAGGEQGAQVWDVDLAEGPVSLGGHAGIVYAVGFSPDGLQVVTGCGDGVVRLWSSDGKVGPVILGRHQDKVVSSVQFDHDGRKVLSTSVMESVARIWSASGSEPPVELKGHAKPIYSASYDETGRFVVTTSEDGTARVWAADGTGTPVVLEGHAGPVSVAAFSSDGQQVVTGGQDGTVRVWAADGGSDPVVLEGHQGPINFVAFSKDGSRVVSTSEDGTGRVWDAYSSVRPTVLTELGTELRSAAFNSADRNVVAADDDGAVRILTRNGAGTPVIVKTRTFEGTGITVAADGGHVYGVASDSTVHVWSLFQRGEDTSIGDQIGPDARVALSMDATKLADWTPSVQKVTIRSEAGKGSPIVLPGVVDGVWTMSFSPDGRRVAAGGEGGTKVWSTDGSSGPLTLGQDLDSLVYDAAFSPDGRTLVTGNGDGTIHVWSADGLGPPSTIDRHDGVVSSVAFDLAGTRVVSTSAMDNKARIALVSGLGQSIVLDHPDGVFFASFNSDGRSVLTLSGEGRAVVWSVPPGPGPALIEYACDRLGRNFLSKDEIQRFGISRGSPLCAKREHE